MKNMFFTSLLCLCTTFLFAQNGAIIYENANYKGKSKTLKAGKYNSKRLGIKNNSLSSIKVLKGYQVTLYDAGNLKGKKLRLKKSIAKLKKFDNLTSSIVVSKIKKKKATTKPASTKKKTRTPVNKATTSVIKKPTTTNSNKAPTSSQIASKPNGPTKVVTNVNIVKLKKAYVQLPFKNKVSHVQYEVIDGNAVMEDDIIIGTESEIKANSPKLKLPYLQQRAVGSQTNGGITKIAAAQLESEYRWENNTVPYMIKDSDFTPAFCQIIRNGIQHLEDNTNINFIARTNEKDYIKFVKTDRDVGGSSSLGRRGGKQKLYLNLDNANMGTVVHECLHALGFFHEHTRADRDQYITIHWDKIERGAENNFEKHDHDGVSFGVYDFGSIMHYGGSAFAKVDDETTISRKNSSEVINAQRVALSPDDIAGINALYPPLLVIPSAQGPPSINQLRTVQVVLEDLKTLNGPNEKAPCNKKMDYLAGIDGGAATESQGYYAYKSNAVVKGEYGVLEGNDIHPNWKLNVPIDAGERYAFIYIRIEDKDSAICGGKKDDIDVNSIIGEKHIRLWVDTQNDEIILLDAGNMAGHYSQKKTLGKSGESIEISGSKSYDHAAKLTFRINIL